VRFAVLPRCTPFVIAGAGAAGLLFGWGWWWGAGLVDDAYIFLRYADNVAHGSGMVFNPGERVEGFSSPAWAGLLTIARVVSPHIESAALLLGGATGAGLAFLVVYALTRPDAAGRDRWTGVLLALGLVSLPAVVFWSFSGMDHPFFTLLVTAALVTSLADMDAQRVSAGTALLLAAAMIARPEGVLLAGWIGLFFSARHGRIDTQWLRRIVLPLGLAGIAPLLMIIARYLYFGSLLPNTLYAKVTPDTWERLARGAVYLRRCLRAHVPLLAIGGAVGVAAWRLRVLPARETAFLGGWIVLWSLYLEYQGGDHFAMFRFFLPVLPAVVILIGLLWRSVRAHTTPAWRVAFHGGMVAAFALSIAWSMAIDGRRAILEPRLSAAWGKAGRWIAQHTDPDTLVATDVIGAIGYYSQRRIVDMLGLVDPVVAHEGAVYRQAMAGHGRYHTDYIFERAPDLVVYATSGRFPARPFAPETLPAPWHFSIIDFAADPRCNQRYEHVSVPLADGTWVEMQKKRTFALGVPYAVRAADTETAANQVD
jgi:arabinofuranosyltransferase